MTHYGYDFSNWSGPLPKSGLLGEFAFLEATWGASGQNEYVFEQTSALRDQGKLPGFYHFLDPAVPISDQILNFYNVVSAAGGSNLPLALDFETPPTDWQAAAYAIVDFCQHIESWTNFVPNPRSILYVNVSFYDQLVRYGFPWGRWIWLAEYGVSAPQRPCLVWQSSANGRNDGITTDPDVFLGSEAEWAAFTRGTVAQPTPPPPIFTDNDIAAVLGA